MDRWFKIRYIFFLIIFYCIFVAIGAFLGYLAGENIGLAIGLIIGSAIARALCHDGLQGLFLFFDKLLLRFLRLLHSFRKFIITVVVLFAIGGGVLFYHDKTYSEISRACSNAERASTLEKRKTFLKKGFDASKKFGLFIPGNIKLFGKYIVRESGIKECEEIQLQLSNMLDYGICSDYLLEDVPCQCGLIDWTPGDVIASCTRRSDLECTTNSKTDEDVIGCF